MQAGLIYSKGLKAVTFGRVKEPNRDPELDHQLQAHTARWAGEVQQVGQVQRPIITIITVMYTFRGNASQGPRSGVLAREIR